MTNKNMKMLTSLGFTEMQTRITRYNFMPINLVKFRSLTRSPIRCNIDQWLVEYKLV